MYPAGGYMENNALKQAMKKRFWLALVLSVLLVAGIPMIPIGFAFGIYPVGILGIVFAVVGFYGCPVAWTTYGSLASYRGAYSLIEEDGVRSVNDLASTLGVPQRKAKEMVTYLINKRFLRGYTFDGADKITPISVPAAEKRNALDLGKCPNCGATLTLDGGSLKCPYCGSVFPNTYKR